MPPPFVTGRFLPFFVVAVPNSLPPSNVPAGSAATSGIEDLRPIIDAALESACEFEVGCPPELAEAIRYALLAPGKRLRPALVLVAAEACGGSFDDAMPGAVAVEMVHAYSLIHDDLPAMDDDDLRRGRPTVHIKFDEATAILAGDGLLAQSFSHLARHVQNRELAAEAVAVLAVAAGPENLVGGQADDLAAESESVAPASQKPEEAGDDGRLRHLESIHRRKTGALFAASLDLGAILAGAKQSQRIALSNYARDLGLAFQIVDDLLDYTADANSLGKRAGKDADRGKLTYPGLMGIDRARDRAKQLVAAAQQEVAVFGALAWRLESLASYVLERER